MKVSWQVLIQAVPDPLFAKKTFGSYWYCCRLFHWAVFRLQYLTIDLDADCQKKSLSQCDCELTNFRCTSFVARDLFGMLPLRNHRGIQKNYLCSRLFHQSRVSLTPFQRKMNIRLTIWNCLNERRSLLDHGNCRLICLPVLLQAVSGKKRRGIRQQKLKKWTLVLSVCRDFLSHNNKIDIIS